MPDSDDDTPSAQPIAADVSDAVVKAYYPAAVAAADAARDRAQRAYGVSSAIAASIVALGAFSDFESRPVGLQALGILTAAAWLASAVCFMYTIGASEPAAAGRSYGTSDEFVGAVLERARKERDAVNERQAWARRISAVAVALTLLTISLFALAHPVSDDVDGDLQLVRPLQPELASLCPHLADSTHVSLAVATLEHNYVRFALRQPGCPRTTIYVPRALVRMFASHG